MAEEVAGKPKKPFYKKWWFWVIAVIIVGTIISNSGGGSSSSDTATAPASGNKTDSAPAAEAVKVAKVGDALKVGDLVFTVKDAGLTKELKSPLGNKKGNWMVVTVTVKNGSKEAVTIDSSFFKLLEGDGTTYETDSDNLMYLDAEQNFFLEQINPKLEKTGKILFAIPDGVKDLKLQVQTGAFGTETGEISLAK